MFNIPSIITRQYLRDNPKYVFVFGDNLDRRGLGGGAGLRHEPNTYGFITKKEPFFFDRAYYRPTEYIPIYNEEIEKLKIEIETHQFNLYLISKLGGGLANRFKIHDIIKARIRKDLLHLSNVIYIGDWIGEYYV